METMLKGIKFDSLYSIQESRDEAAKKDHTYRTEVFREFNYEG